LPNAIVIPYKKYKKTSLLNYHLIILFLSTHRVFATGFLDISCAIVHKSQGFSASFFLSEKAFLMSFYFPCKIMSSSFLSLTLPNTFHFGTDFGESKHSTAIQESRENKKTTRRVGGDLNLSVLGFSSCCLYSDVLASYR
jgi:hypothetical protein